MHNKIPNTVNTVTTDITTIAGIKNSGRSFFSGASVGKKSSMFIRENKYPRVQPICFLLIKIILVFSSISRS